MAGERQPEAEERAARRFGPDLFLVAYERMNRHGADGLAAGLAFGALLSSAPLLLVVLAALGALLGEGAARREVLQVVSDALGARPSELVAGWIDEADAWSATATAFGLVFFFFGAGRLALLVDAAFKVVFEVPEPPHKTGLRGAIRDYLRLHALSLVVTLGASLLLLVSMLVGEGALRVFGGGDVESFGALVGRWVLSSGFLFASVALTYWLLPPVRLERVEVLEGALVTTILLVLGIAILRALSAALELGAAYGAASAIVGTLLALYWAAQAFLYGAELTGELARRRRRASGTAARSVL